MNRHRSIRSLLIVAAAGAALASCGTEPQPEPLIHTPGTGSAYHFTNFSKDTNGEKISTSETHSTRTILATNASVVGKTGVVQFLDVSEGSAPTPLDTSSMHFEGNGDVMFLQPAIAFPSDQFPAPQGIPLPNISIPARWVQLPFGSKAPTTIPEYDTTISVSISGFTIPVNLKVGGTAAFINNEDLAVGAETLSTQKGLVTVNVQFSALVVGSGTIKTVDSIWFAPKLGMFVKDDGLTTSQLPAQFGTSGTMGGSYNMITSYTLK